MPAYHCSASARRDSYGSMTLRYEMDVEGKLMRRLLIWNVPGGSAHPLHYLTLFFVLDGSKPARIGPRVDTVRAAHGAHVGRNGPRTANAVLEVEGGAVASKPWNLFAEERARGKSGADGSAPFYRGDGYSNAMMDSLDKALATGAAKIDSRIVGSDGATITRARFHVRATDARDTDLAKLGEAVELLALDPRKNCARQGQ